MLLRCQSISDRTSASFREERTWKKNLVMPTVGQQLQRRGPGLPLGEKKKVRVMKFSTKNLPHLLEWIPLSSIGFSCQNVSCLNSVTVLASDCSEHSAQALLFRSLSCIRSSWYSGNYLSSSCPVYLLSGEVQSSLQNTSPDPQLSRTRLPHLLPSQSFNRTPIH